MAIGRNYVDHVKELNNTVPKEPFFFLKPTTSYVQSGGAIEIHEECWRTMKVSDSVVRGEAGGPEGAVGDVQLNSAW